MIFVFWNIGRLKDIQIVNNLVHSFDVDLLALAECDEPPASVQRALNKTSSSFYNYCDGLCEKVRIFSRLPMDLVTPVYEADRLTIRRIRPPVGSEFLLAAMHFPSKRDWSPESQLLECNSLANSIEEAEAQIGHSRTVLMGDLNMNPFEAGVVGSRGLHATMSRRVASEGGREVQGRYYKFFYNPMWTRFGDSNDRPPGSYYYRRAEHVCYFWNLFDQCLVRPELLYAFDETKLEVLSTDGVNPLTSQRKGLPSVSDHLPILIELSP